MPGDLAAPVRFHHRRARVTGRAVQRAGPLPGREHRFMLQQHARVRDLIVAPLLVQLALDLPAAQGRDGLAAEAGMQHTSSSRTLPTIAGDPEPPCSR